MRSKKALKNLFTSLILQLVVVVYGFVVPKIIITNFGSEVNGLVASITQFLGYIVFLEAGFGPVIKSMLYKPIAEKNKNAIMAILKSSEVFFRRIAIIFVAYIVVLIVVYPFLVNRTFDVFFTISLIVIIAISIFAEYFFGMTYRIFLNAKQKSYVVSLVQIVTYIVSIVAVIIAANLGASIHLIKLISSLAFIFRPIIQNLYVKRRYHIDLSRVHEQAIIEQKWDGLAQHIASVIHSNTDVMVLTLFSSLTNVSIYSVYSMVTKSLKSIVQPFSNEVEATFGDMMARGEYEGLARRFRAYEILYNSIMATVFSCVIVLIVPFVEVYTIGVTDADYVAVAFAILLVLGEYVWAIRQPYNGLIKAAGHFRETRRGAWVEAGVNIVLSIILVFHFGLVGVAIGTIVAMFIRAVEFIYHANKYILKRSNWESIKKIVLVMVETITIVFTCNYLPFLDNNNYGNWIVNAAMAVLVSLAVVLCLNVLFFGKDLKLAIADFKKIIKRKS